MGYGAGKPGFKQATQKKFVKRVGQMGPNDGNGAESIETKRHVSRI